MSTSPRGKHFRRIAVSLALGVATSVIVAWAIALADIQTYTYVHSISVNIAPDGQPTSTSGYGYADEYRPAFTRVELAADNPDRTFDRLVAERVRAELLAKAEGPPPEWTSELYPPRHPEWPPWLTLPPAGERYTAWSARAAGWPMLCLCSRTTVTADGASRTRGAIRVRAASTYKSNTRDPGAGTLPLIPVLPGLAVNTALYGTTWWLLLFAPGELRRAVRRRRGHCPACGYDLGGDLAGGCPECGLGRHASAPDTSRGS